MIIQPCKQCGKPIEVPASLVGRKRFCSVACRTVGVGAENVKTYSLICTICGTPFTIESSAHRRTKTCSPACARIGRARRDPEQSKRITRKCLHCGAAFLTFPSRLGAYCSRKCSASHKNSGKLHTSTTLPCGYCGKPVKQFASRAKLYDRQFCNNDCYHAWDSLYKSTPEMLAHLADRRRRDFGKPSKIEDRVAEWLDKQGLKYERQVTLKVYSMDFKVGNAYIEVQGCYWHGCAVCFPLYTPQQRKQQSRDKGKATYCQRRGIQLLTVWEHDITHENYSSLISLLVPG